MEGDNSMSEPIRILHVFGNMELGGAESRVMDLYRNIDRETIQFDFLVHTTKECFYDKEIRDLGGRLFAVPRFRFTNFFAYKNAMKKFFCEHHEFRAVQGHMTSTAAIYLPIAKKAGIPFTIAHARSAGTDPGLKGWLTRFLRRNLWKKADVLFTCSKEAALSAFGERAYLANKVTFIPNAIETEPFRFDVQKRKRMRRENGIPEEALVFGHVGRFHYAKNHEYLLKVFKEILVSLRKEETMKEKPLLILLGDGPRMQEMEALAEELGIFDSVKFLGRHANISDYYQMMDCFLYPSRYEGLPGTIVEAQCNGLPVFMSDTICEEVVITDLIQTMSIEAAPSEWAEVILSWLKEKKEDSLEDKRLRYYGIVQKSDFDVKTESVKIQKYYEEIHK